MIHFPATLNTEQNTVTVHTTCSQCGALKDIGILASEYYNWQKGTLIQNAMPHLSANDREFDNEVNNNVR